MSTMVHTNFPKRNVKDLKKLFENLNEALDTSKHLDLGYKHYKEAKRRTLTLEREKKKRSTPTVQNIFPQQQEEKENSTSDDQTFQEVEKKTELDLLSEKLKKENGERVHHKNGENNKKNQVMNGSTHVESNHIAKEKQHDVNEKRSEEKVSEEIKENDNKEAETKPEDVKVETCDKSIQTENDAEEAAATTFEIPSSCPLKDKISEDLLKKTLAFLSLEELSELKKAIEEAEEEAEKTKQESAPPLFIQTDKDLVLLIMDVIHEAFYNPDTGFWPVYDAQFNREEFIRFGKKGWDHKKDSEERAAAREFINVEKNKEIQRVLEGQFVEDTTKDIYEVLQTIVSGVKYEQVARAIENHVRVHIYHLIYGQENVRNPKIYQQ